MTKQPVFTFTGKLERRDGYIIATDDHASLMAYGQDEDEALERMEMVIDAYLQTLDERNEIELAVQAGKLKLEMVPTPSPSPSPEWAIPRLAKTDGHFRAQIPTLAAS